MYTLGISNNTVSFVFAIFEENYKNNKKQGSFRMRTRAGGLKLKGMPTKFEKEGQRFAERQAEPTLERQHPVSDKKTLWQHAVEWKNSTVTKEAADYGAVIIEPDQYHEVSMTNLIMSNFPDIRFREFLKNRIPSSESIDLCATWGYDMKYLPPNGLGAAYTDVYSSKLWLENADITLPLVPTSIAYTCMITRDSIAGNRLTSENERRADRRDFEAGFVKDKRLAQEFYNAGALKGQQGDNHVAFLLQALSKVLSIKQAEECQSFCEVIIDRDVFANLMLVEDDARTSTSAAIAKRLASPWIKDQGREVHELILPSAAANAEEVITLLYLMGALDHKEKFHLKRLADHPLDIKPFFGCIVTGVHKLLRIPLCNSQHLIDMEAYIGKKIRIELGTLEETLTSYVKRFNLHDQVNIAKNLLCTAVISNPLGEQVEQVVAAPKPNHACEYDLWQRSTTKENTTFITFSVYEEANLLVSLLQIQGEVMRQAVCVSALEELELQKTPMMSTPGKINYEKWLNTTFDKGPRQLLSGWCSGMLGLASVEVESLITNNLQAFSSLLWKTLRSDPVKVSAQLWSGVRCTRGPLGLIWDKARRDKEAERSYVDSSTAGVLSSLYNNKSNCFDARGPWMLLLCASTTQIRGLKRDVVASGQRNILNLKGEPKLVYFGMRPESTANADRLRDAGTAMDLTSHYEPAFDLDSAATLLATKINLAVLADEKEREKHKGEPTTTGQTKNKGVYSEDYKLPEIAKDSQIQYASRPYISGPYEGGDYLSQVSSAQAYESKYEKERWQKVASRSGWTTGVGGRVVFNSRNARTNGLSSTMERLVKEREQRLADAQKTMAKPISQVGSEIIDPSSVEVSKRAEELYKQSSMEEELIGGFTLTASRAIHEGFDVFDVPGDGRCGIRALHQGMVLKNQTKNLSDMMQMEATMFGGTSHRLPRETHVDDGAMAMMADKLGYHLIVVEQESADSDQVDTLRYHKNDSMPDRETLFVKIVGSHWYALQDKVKKPFDDIDEFIDTRREYYSSRHSTPEKSSRRTGTGGGQTEEGIPPMKPGVTLEPKATFNKKMRHVITIAGGRVGKHPITCNEIGSKGDYVESILPKQKDLATPHNVWSQIFRRKEKMERLFGHYINLRKGLEPDNFVGAVLDPVTEWYKFTPDEAMKWAHSEMSEESLRAFVAFTSVGLGVASLQTTFHQYETRLLGTRSVYARGRDDDCILMPLYEINGRKYVAEDNGRMADIIRGMGGLGERIQYMATRYVPVGAEDKNKSSPRMPKRFHFEENFETVRRRISEAYGRIRGAVDTEEYVCPNLHKLVTEATRPVGGEKYLPMLDAVAAGFAMVGRPADAKWVLHSATQWVTDVIGEGVFELSIFDTDLAILIILHRGGRAWFHKGRITGSDTWPHLEKHTLQDWYTAKNRNTIPMVLARSEKIGWHVYELNAPLRAIKRLQELSNWCKSVRNVPEKDRVPHPGIALPPNNSTGGVKTNDSRQWELLGILTIGAGSLAVGAAGAGTLYTVYRYRFCARRVFQNMYYYILTSSHSLINEMQDWMRRDPDYDINWGRYGILQFNQRTPDDESRLYDLMAGSTNRVRENSYRSWYSLGSWESFWSVDLGGDEHEEL